MEGGAPYQSAFYPSYGNSMEPSTLIRYLSVLSSRIEGDFDFDFVRTMIALFPVWVAEGEDQQQVNERLVNATMFILAVLQSEDVGLNDEIADLEAEINSCNIVEVYTTSSEDVNAKGDIIIGWGTSLNEKGSSGGNVSTKEASHKIFCRREFYEQGLHCAAENGYRRINCGARVLFYKALRLAAKADLLNPKRNMVMIRPQMHRAEDYDDPLK